MEKFNNMFDEYMNLNARDTFDRFNYTRRKNSERRISCCTEMKPGYVVRSEKDRRSVADRRRRWTI